MGNLRMAFQETGDFQRVLAVAFHANPQRLHAAQRQPGVKGAHAAAGDILQPDKPRLIDKLLLADDDPANNIPVSVDVFRDAVNHDIGSLEQGLLAVRRHKGVIHNQQHAPLMGDPGDRFDIDQGERWVGRRFDVHHFGFRADGFADLIRVGGINETHVNTELRYAVRQKCVRAAINRAG